MELAFAFIGLPIATYLALASLRQGRPAMIGILSAAVVAGLGFIMQSGGNDGYTTAMIMLIFSAIALAALVQVLRRAIGKGRPAWVYPALVVLALVGAGVPMLLSLGV